MIYSQDGPGYCGKMQTFSTGLESETELSFSVNSAPNGYKIMDGCKYSV